MQEGLKIYTAYDHPKDFPNHIVVRCWIILAGKTVPVLEPRILASTIEEVREYMLRRGLVILPRETMDEPVIIESYI